MALTTLLFVSIFLACLLGSLFIHPLLGVCGFVVTYVISPAYQWWGADLARMGLRYSFFMALAIAAGMLLHSRKLSYPGKFYSQEILFLLLVGWTFLSTHIGVTGIAGDNFAFKLFKVAVFLWMLIRIVDRQKNYEIFLWTLVLATVYVGYDALGVSTSDFGRIDRGVGGSDFAEGNFLAAHFAMTLPFLGIFFIKGSKVQKCILLVSAVLLVNGIILCRSRGAFVALALGMASAIYFAPKTWRSKIVTLILVGLAGSLILVDEGFIERMQRINPNLTDIELQDDSASGRILAWNAALSMAQDHPLGIGQGNFARLVGDYQPNIPGKDTHNTYLRALAELGLPGLFLMLMMIWTAFKILRTQKQRIEAHGLAHDLLLHVYAQSVALVICLSAGVFITQTYIEEFYWLLMLPVLLERVVDRQMAIQRLLPDVAPSPEANYLPALPQQADSHVNQETT